MNFEIDQATSDKQFKGSGHVNQSNSSFVGDETYIKDFKASNIQDTNEEIPLLLCVQHLVDTDDHPQEHPFIDGLGQGSH